jgi:cytochrome c oxidase subunit II
MRASQEMLDAAGVQAAHIADLWWLMVAVCAVVFAGVVSAMLWAVWRSPRSDAATPPDLSSLQRKDKRAGLVVWTAVSVSALALVALIGASAATDRKLLDLPLANGLNIELTANQFWWDVKYDPQDPQRRFSTANEIHIPVGRPIVVTLKSNDVIHSFWVPNLHGKKDLIPGRTGTILFRADKPGTYRGQCAEFCGFQHAKMALLVIAEPAEQFEEWAAQQRTPPPEPKGDAAKGRELFLSKPCLMCHAIAGTPALARRAPDLTHVAGRRTLAAGAVDNSPENLARWIQDPQAIKPGSNMPTIPLADGELKPLLAYLQTLQ